MYLLLVTHFVSHWGTMLLRHPKLSERPLMGKTNKAGADYKGVDLPDTEACALPEREG